MRTSDQFYLLAAQSFQDMNDWVNCLRLVAFGQSSSSQSVPATGCSAAPQTTLNNLPVAKRPLATATVNTNNNNNDARVDVLLDKRITGGAQKPEMGASQAGDFGRSIEGGKQQVPRSGGLMSSVATAMGGGGGQQPGGGVLSSTCNSTANQKLQNQQQQQITTASQAALAAANALAKTRQRQPSLLGSCKPQPPTDSPFIKATTDVLSQQQQQVAGKELPPIGNIGCLDTLTPTVRGQLIMGSKQASAATTTTTPVGQQANQVSQRSQPVSKAPNLQESLDEEEENMLYCSIEDNPSEHNYRVKVIETELSLRCQLKCYQLTASTTISQQYEQVGRFNPKTGAYLEQAVQAVTFYQLIVGPQELTLLNDYAAAASLMKRPASSQQQQQQQGLWSWPYQCIRRYGFDKDNCFMFEAGRKCTSGPGQFIVQTPKAYNIYQDVVKFVNELRSLSAANTCAEPAAAVAAGAGKRDTNQTSSNNQQPTSTGSSSSGNFLNVNSAAKQQEVVVTQIPVIWAPNSISNTHNANETTDSSSSTRQQFFDTLRQLESAGTAGVQKVTNNNLPVNSCNKNNKINEEINHHRQQKNSLTVSSTTSHNHHQQPVSSPSSKSAVSVSSSHTKSSSATSSPISMAKAAMNKCQNNNPGLPAVKSQSSSSSSSSSTSKQIISGEQANKCDTNSSSAATSEETDESGYEQGDDSVDSARFKLKSVQNIASRKRQTNESTSSSSSSTSSSSAGSPGHSVSRRSTSGASSNCSTTSSNSVSKQWPPLISGGGDAPQRKENAGLETKPTGNRLHGLHSLIVEEALGGQPEDFEANLIRDVYSEITKLHAKFAVASGSAEDLMSSNSSNNGSAGGSSNNSYSGNNEEAEECGMSSNGHSALNEMSEPMYTNLRLTGARRARSDSFVHLIDDQEEENEDDEHDDFDDDDDDNDMVVPNGRSRFKVQTRLQHPSSYSHDNLQQGSRVPQHPSYTQNQLDYLSPRFAAAAGPIYPTMLNPIPECGELSSSQPPKVMPKPSSVLIGQRLLASSNHQNSVNYVQHQQHQQNNRQQLGRSESSKTKSKQQQQQTTLLMKSKLPTNHYVINDVQYAKISRNLCAKYESCL